LVGVEMRLAGRKLGSGETETIGQAPSLAEDMHIGEATARCGLERVEGLVQEDETEADGVAGPVAVEEVNRRSREGALHQ
jgi:hypothetical protein